MSSAGMRRHIPALAQARNTIQETTLRATTTLLAHAGPRIARIKPLRRAIVGRIEAWIADKQDRDLALGVRPPGVCRDRAQIGLALLHTLERAVADGRLGTTAARSFIQILGHRVLIEKGDQATIEQFRKEHGVLSPAFMVISPGKACNLHCIGCYADSEAGNDAKLEASTFDRIIAEAKTLWGARFFVISGGEPFAYRSNGQDLLDVLARHDDCYFMSYTNGTLIDDRVAVRLAEIGNLTPAISVEGGREQTDARRGDGVFDQILAAMGRLRRAGVPFGVSLTATRHNAEEILSDEFVDFFFGEQGAIYGWLFHYMPIGRAYTVDLMPTPEQRLWMWRRGWELVRERQIFIADFWNFGTACEGCLSAGRYKGGGYFYIDWNGAVCPCVFVPYSPVNVNQAYAAGKTLNDIWADPFFAGIREWQEGYRSGRCTTDGRHGNWLAPCIIRDHHDVLRRLLAEHEPDPTDDNARDALLDAEYAQAMIDYGAAYQALSDKVWEEDYLNGQGRNVE